MAVYKVEDPDADAAWWAVDETAEQAAERIQDHERRVRALTNAELLEEGIPWSLVTDRLDARLTEVLDVLVREQESWRRGQEEGLRTLALQVEQLHAITDQRIEQLARMLGDADELVSRLSRDIEQINAVESRVSETSARIRASSEMTADLLARTEIAWRRTTELAEEVQAVVRLVENRTSRGSDPEEVVSAGTTQPSPFEARLGLLQSVHRAAYRALLRRTMLIAGSAASLALAASFPRVRLLPLVVVPVLVLGVVLDISSGRSQREHRNNDAYEEIAGDRQNVPTARRSRALWRPAQLDRSAKSLALSLFLRWLLLGAALVLATAPPATAFMAVIVFGGFYLYLSARATLQTLATCRYLIWERPQDGLPRRLLEVGFASHRLIRSYLRDEIQGSSSTWQAPWTRVFVPATAEVLALEFAAAELFSSLQRAGLPQEYDPSVGSIVLLPSPQESR